MQNIVKTLALICVFFVLTPGVLIRLPIKGGIYKIAAVHALLFGAIYFIVTNMFGVLREGYGYDPIYCKSGWFNQTCNEGNSAPSVSDQGKYACTSSMTADGIRYKQRCTKSETSSTGPASYGWQSCNTPNNPNYTCDNNTTASSSCDSNTSGKCKSNKKAYCKKTPGKTTTTTSYGYI